MKLNFKHKYTGAIKSAPTGFSFTVMFFGYLVPALRGDIKNAVMMTLLFILTLGLANFYYMFAYNGLYIRSLLADGYSPADDYTMNQLRAMGYVYENK